MRDTGILIKNFADPFPKKNIVFTGVSISGAHLFFFLLAMILWNALSVSIKWNFWNSIMLINVFLLKKCTRKQCPDLVHFFEGGQSVQDAAAVAAYLEQEYGVNALHVTRVVHLHDEFMWAPGLVHGGFNGDLVT